MSKMIEFSIPDFYHKFDLNMNLIILMQKEPGLFMNDVKIDSVYGAFPGCMWNSGRATIGQATYDNIYSTIHAFASMGIDVRHTFTNMLLEEKHLVDPYCNVILEISERVVAETGTPIGVNCNRPILHDYVKKMYPSLYTLWSTTRDAKSVEALNEVTKDEIAVAYYGMNNTSALDKFEHPENVEILVSEACIENCPNRQHHYESISKLQLIQPSDPFRCPNGCEGYFFYDQPVKRAHYVSPEAIREIYLPRGINKFKIGGRNDNLANTIENYVIYFARPEHRDNVRNKLLCMHFNGQKLYYEMQQQRMMARQ